ncbi:unnamed protein product [Caenorhabditis bovis]|uniref:HSF-type DNA-binding domain-containing protein n=1 Tax=Caenorhabditis bovis TaxID=2654633 RepID=A0A8S1F9E7_9PELO|nr:unnamed protein product [Caenorhabditis bovis]
MCSWPGLVSAHRSDDGDDDRVRVFSTGRKMNQNGANMLPNRVPKVETNQSRRIANGQPASSVQQQQPSQVINGRRGNSNGVSIEEVPSAQYIDNINGQAPKYDEEKLPLFLIKLWNIVEDPTIQSIVHWDESGASFHIADPYSFCRNVLPHYFKHNNLNSLIRQLNMYGFRKMTPLNQGGLTRTESDQDHLEFSHPYFVQGHPELLVHIKRKQSTRTEDKNMSVQTQQNLDLLMSEVRTLREKHRNMEAKMNSLTKENRQLWDQMSNMRQQHNRQAAVVKKLFHFLVSMVQPNLSKRVAKRGVLAIDEYPGSSSPTPKRARPDGQGPSAPAQYSANSNAVNANPLTSNNFCEMLEALQRELQEPPVRRFSNNAGPLIADVTDEFGSSPGAASRGNSFSDVNGEIVGNGVGVTTYSGPSSREVSPSPNVVTPQSKPSPEPTNALTFEQQFGNQVSSGPYLGSGPLLPEPTYKPPVTQKMANQMIDSNINRKQPKRSFKNQNQYAGNATVYQPTGQIVQHNPNVQGSLMYEPQNQVALQKRDVDPIDPKSNLNSLNYDHQESYSPSLVMSPTLERQISQELQEYLNGVDFSIENCRDLINAHDWDNFGDNLEEDYSKYEQNGPQQLALEHMPKNDGLGQNIDPQMQMVSPAIGDLNGFDPFAEGGYPSVPVDQEQVDQYPTTPVLLTPGSSPSRM